MMRVNWRTSFVWIPVATALLLMGGCEGPEGPPGTACSVTDNGDGTATIACEDGTTATVAGPTGNDGTSCTATDNMDGTVTIDCEDGTSVTVTNGTAGDSCTVTDNMDGTATVACDDGTMVIVSDGVAGSSCSAVDNMDGTVTVSCTDGTTVTVANGDPGLNAGESPGLAPTVTVSAPANGTHFVAGETIVITITLLDGDGDPIDPSALSTNRLYMAGPRAATVTESAVELLGANEDRSIQPHHYINLATTTATNLVVAGNVLTFTTNAVTTEPAGTYDIGFRGALAGYTYDRVFTLAEVQIGTATAEANAFDGCVDCHLGPDNNQMYMHHVDSSSGSGSPEIDNGAITSCKLCHNNDGYATVRLCGDGTKAESLGGGNYICGDGSTTYTYMNDSILRRAHGLHHGADLVSTFNAGAFNPDFEDYLELEFPADIKNCVKCHSDDRWMTAPSASACGACHDGANFVSPAVGILCNDTSNPDLCDHPAGLDLAPASCAGCHGTGTAATDIPVVHAVDVPPYTYTVNVSITPPAAGTYYVAGETPTVTLEVIDDSTGNAVDPATFVDPAWSRARFMVSGPRDGTVPALTAAAEGLDQVRANVSSPDGAAPFDLSGATSLDFDIDGTGAITCLVSAGTFVDNSAATVPEVETWLLGCLGGTGSIHTSGGSTPNVIIFSDSRGTGATVEILASGDAAGALGMTPGVYGPVETASYKYNDLRLRADPYDNDPYVVRNATNMTYTLADVGSVPPGTYTVYFEVRGTSSSNNGLAWINIQIGTDTVESDIATNCVDCHEATVMHGVRPFVSDVCKTCHDYGNQLDGRVSWSNNQWGFGAGPLSRRIHGTHFAHYVENPGSNNLNSLTHVIFPMDVRNCTKCHSENDKYASEPNRVACSGCHDSDAGWAHMTLMTVDLTPTAPFSGDEMESCTVCHGLGSGLAVDVVHNIWDPYVKPYPR